ncbi:MAG TPA: N-acetylmuramoyl-L-alanine amidase [Nocardioidaceae bacterium]|nr:N-acetylmuramoyl-L-alanine amidase [Nocardioidaceae bacterium]
MPATLVNSKNGGRTALRLAITLSTVCGTGALVTTAASTQVASMSATARSAQVTPVVTTLTVPTMRSGRQAAGPDSVVSSLAATGTATRFDLVAMTWAHASAPAAMTFEVKVRHGADWSSWQQLEFDSSEGPGVGEDGSLRDGTALLWVGDANGVQARALSRDGSTPKSLRVVVIDPGSSPVDQVAADDAAADTALTYSAAAGALPAMPSIVSRRQWGADGSIVDGCWQQYGSTVKAVFVHHTVGSNSYSRADGPAIVRGIQAYHTQARGWCDIGYNFLVDRYGTVYQGRRGGILKPVHGAHAGDYNSNSVGISLMGDFSTQPTTKAMRHGLVQLVAWRLGAYYRSAHSWATLNDQRFARISGHRDAMATACPGQTVYDWIPALRDRVARQIGDVRTPIHAKWRSLREQGARLGSVFVGERAVGDGRVTTFGRGRIYWSSSTGAHVLTGAILQRFQRLGGVASRLGFPDSDVRDASVVGSRRARFDGGAIYWSPRTGARPLFGAILARYLRTGGAGGGLGLPTSSEYVVSDGRRQNFQHGTITWIASSGRTYVTYS